MCGPVIGSGKDDPSKESREHVIWQENGLLTVTGGKLTTFRRIALDVLKEMRDHLPDLPPIHDKQPVFESVELCTCRRVSRLTRPCAAA